MSKPLQDGEDQNFNILNTCLGRLWKRTPFVEPILTLEVLVGEWKGIVFSYKTFHMLPVQMEGGFVPCRFETEIHIIPDNLPKDWTPDERFDAYTSEVLFKWLSYIHMNDLAPLIAMRTHGIQ